MLARTPPPPGHENASKYTRGNVYWLKTPKLTQTPMALPLIVFPYFTSLASRQVEISEQLEEARGGWVVLGSDYAGEKVAVTPFDNLLNTASGVVKVAHE